MKKEFNLLPGPSGLYKKFTKFLLKTPISQRSDKFLEFWFNTKNLIKLLVDNPYGEIAILTCSSTGAMEASIVSLCNKNSNVLVVSSGKFGDRFFEILNSYSIKTKKLSFFETKKIDYNLIEEEIKNSKYTHITYQICETSSGIYCNPQIIGEFAKKFNLITIADGVSAFLADHIYQKEYNIDALILGSQKGLNSPAGLSFVSLSPKTIDILNKADINSYYFYLKKYLNLPPFTPAINTIFYINKILEEIYDIGVNDIIERNVKIASKIRNNCLNYNIKLYPIEPSNAVSVFEFDDSENFIKFCEKRFNLYIAHGQGYLKGKVFRLGHFGLTESKSYNIFLLALEKFFKR